MRFSACFLRKIPLYKAGTKTYLKEIKPALFKPVFINTNNLGYKFYLLKPKEALVVNDKDLNKNEKDQLEKKGIIAIALSESSEPLIFKGSTPYIAILKNHTLSIKDKRLKLPVRIIKDDNNILNFSQDNYKNTILDAYKEYIFSLANQKGIQLIINFASHSNTKIEKGLQKKWERIEDVFNNQTKLQNLNLSMIYNEILTNIFSKDKLVIFFDRHTLFKNTVTIAFFI